MEKMIYNVPTLKVLQFGYLNPFCDEGISLLDIDEEEETDEPANNGFFDDDVWAYKSKRVWE